MGLFRRSGKAARTAPERTETADTAAVAPAGAVNGHQVLETVVALPISTWRYLWEPEQVRHIGPMAQDWHASFDFHHENTRVIPVVDANGIALVCIQALNRRIDELTTEVRRLSELRDAGDAGDAGARERRAGGACERSAEEGVGTVRGGTVRPRPPSKQ
ncbi:tail fiber domain-containing protein [Kitasatospora sp. NPDC087271]|uniref:tail fiber domain-containing protein n=1 Tax=Kitasatospora sp. NPDC087271 TaxID=3364067 RepID=UPI0037FAC8EA